MAGTPWNKKSKAEHQRAGTFRADRHANNRGKMKGKPLKKTVNPPKCFKLDATEKAYFKETVKLLSEHNLATELDLHAIAVYAQCLNQWQQFWQDLKDNGTTIATEDSFKVNPAGTLMHSAFMRMIAFQRDFGMTAISRQKLEDTGWDVVETGIVDEDGKRTIAMHPSSAAVQTRRR